jgi:hypothetical protein
MDSGAASSVSSEAAEDDRGLRQFVPRTRRTRRTRLSEEPEPRSRERQQEEQPEDETHCRGRAGVSGEQGDNCDAARDERADDRAGGQRLKHAPERRLRVETTERERQREDGPTGDGAEKRDSPEVSHSAADYTRVHHHEDREGHEAFPGKIFVVFEGFVVKAS